MSDDAVSPDESIDKKNEAVAAAQTASSTETDWLDALRQVIDPELMVNIVDLGLIYSVAADEDEDVTQGVAVEMTLTSPACPAGPQLVQQAKMALERLHDIDVAKISLTMSPPWTPERMTDDARDQLGIF
ncbi:MAG: metal-sulfur cluster assembly factor [Fuerstiella sp.]|nr:metal-sulfur cluster assembly factor [Fuerstiella sp.]